MGTLWILEILPSLVLFVAARMTQNCSFSMKCLSQWLMSNIHYHLTGSNLLGSPFYLINPFHLFCMPTTAYRPPPLLQSLLNTHLLPPHPLLCIHSERDRHEQSMTHQVEVGRSSSPCIKPGQGNQHGKPGLQSQLSSRDRSLQTDQAI